MLLSTRLLQRLQVKQDLCHALPAARISSAINTDFSHLGQISAPPHLGLGLVLAVFARTGATFSELFGTSGFFGAMYAFAL